MYKLFSPCFIFCVGYINWGIIKKNSHSILQRVTYNATHVDKNKHHAMYLFIYVFVYYSIVFVHHRDKDSRVIIGDKI